MIYINEGLPSQREATDLEIKEIITLKILKGDIDFLVKNNEYCTGKLGHLPDGTPLNVRDFAIILAKNIFDMIDSDSVAENEDLNSTMNTIKDIPIEIEGTRYCEEVYLELFGGICKLAGLDPAKTIQTIGNISTFSQKNTGQEIKKELYARLKEAIQDGDMSRCIAILQSIGVPADNIKISTKTAPNLTPLHYAINCNQNSLAKELYAYCPTQALQRPNNFSKIEELNYIIAEQEVSHLRKKQKQKGFNAIETAKIFYSFRNLNNANKAKQHIVEYAMENKTEIIKYYDVTLHLLLYLSEADEHEYHELKTAIWHDSRFKNYLISEMIHRAEDTYSRFFRDKDMQDILPASLLCAILQDIYQDDAILSVQIAKIIANKIQELAEFHNNLKLAVKSSEVGDLTKYANSKFGIDILKSLTSEELQELGREKSGILLKPLRDLAKETKGLFEAKNSSGKKHQKPNADIAILDSFLSQAKGKSQKSHIEVLDAIERLQESMQAKTDLPHQEGKKAARKRKAAERKQQREQEDIQAAEQTPEEAISAEETNAENLPKAQDRLQTEFPEESLSIEQELERMVDKLLTEGTDLSK